jgi:putative phage-type endonuclease
MHATADETLVPLTPFEIVCDSTFKRTEWLKARSTGIGASEIATVLGISPWESALALYAKKIGHDLQEEEEKEYLYWGNKLEWAIISGYAERSGRAALPFGLLVRAVRWPWLLATPDALTTDDEEAKKNSQALNRCIGALRRLTRHQRNVPPEVVTEFLHLARGWWPLQTKNIGLWSANHWTEGAPDYYRLQCQQEALLLDMPKCTAAALVAGQKLIWEDVARDELTDRRIVNLSRTFWHEHVLAHVEPKADETESSARALKRMYPLSDPEKILKLPHELLEQAQRRDQLKALEKQTKTELDLIDNTIKQTMGEAAEAVFPDGSGFTYHTIETRERVQVVKAGSYRSLLRKFPKEEKAKKPRKKKAAPDA